MNEAGLGSADMLTMIPLTVLTLIFFLYFIIGPFFAIWFAFIGSNKMDEAARGGKLGFRLILLPASFALWPLLAWKYMRRSKNDHQPVAAQEKE